MYLDIITLIILGISVLSGISNGFVVEFISTFGILINLYITHKLTPFFCKFTEELLKRQDETYVYAITFLVVFMTIAIILHLLNLFLKSQNTSMIFRLLGGFVSLAKGLLICAIMFTFYNVVQEKIEPVRKIGKDSIFNEYFLKVTDNIDFYIPKNLKSKIQEIKNEKTVEKNMKKLDGMWGSK